MADFESFKEVGAIIGGIVAGGVTALLSARKMLKSWEKDGLEIEKTNAEESIIKSLRDESERMATQNARLMEQLSALQLQIGELHYSITKLKSENDTLKQEVVSLHTEINRLRTMKESG